MKNKIIGRVLPCALSICMIAGNVTPALAATAETQNADISNEKMSDTKDTDVLYNQTSTFFVKIPKVISLGTDKQSGYSVAVSGDISSDQQVYVSPIDGITERAGLNFYMKDQSKKNPKADVAADVIQGKFYWDHEDVAKSYEEKANSITAEGLSAGTWKGTFDFEINLHNTASGGCTSDDKEHSYVETVAKEPSCTEEGKLQKVCSTCGDTRTESIPATGHNYVDGICSECNGTSSEYVPVISGFEDGKSYAEGAKLTVRDTETIKINGGAVAGNTYTFDTAGEYTVTVTGDNGKEITIIIIVNHEHNYTETITKEATCTEDGEKTLVCSCGDSKTETIKATGHKYEENTCTECGETKAVYAMLRSTAAETTSTSGFLGSDSAGLAKNVRRLDIFEVFFCDYTEAEGHYLSDRNCWDVSAAQNGSIIAWYESPSYATNKYSIYIAPRTENVKIQAPTNASYMFAYFEGYHMGDKFPLINGFDKIDFSKTTNMSHMFDTAIYSNLHLDMDTSSVTDTSYMFRADNYSQDANTITFGDKADFSKVTNSDYMFYNQSSLNNLTYPKGMTVIGEYAFAYCGKLKDITIPSTVTSIGSNAFRSCDWLTDITIPNGITSINSQAFRDCVNLANVVIPDTVTSIGAGAFSNCTKLTALRIPNTVTSIGYDAFKNVPHVYYTGSATGSPWGAKAIN
ncbi:MAG: leucine-rich repeat protein [Lachnospiraceae bacterium]|nr:leucine-rich repeat protein [Lachnospiraceae bacterium]